MRKSLECIFTKLAFLRFAVFKILQFKVKNFLHYTTVLPFCPYFDRKLNLTELDLLFLEKLQIYNFDSLGRFFLLFCIYIEKDFTLMFERE